MKKIILVGGAGFIGHHLALKLRQLGNEVCVVDGLAVNNFLSLANNFKKNFNYIEMLTDRLTELEKAEVELVIQDARDYHGLSKVFAKIKPDIVVHLAAVAHADRSNKDPYSTFDHSFRTLENVLDICISSALGYNIERLIYFSSSMVYGNFTELVVKEDCSLSPIGIYGALKVAGEGLVKAYNQVFELPYTIIRPSALYGERCISGRVVQKFIESAIQGKSLQIQGDGEDMLDFTYIEDLVRGIVLACFKEQAINQTFNITYGESRSIKSLVEAIRIWFPDIQVEYKKRDKLMPFRGTLSIDKAREMLGYSPINFLEKGAKKYIEWMKWHFNPGE